KTTSNADLQAKHDQLLKLSEGVERKNKELAGTVASLQAEITVLKSKLEAAGQKSAASSDIDALKKELDAEKRSAKDKIDALQKTMQDEKKKADAKIAEYEEKLKKHEDKIASVKEESLAAMRKLIDDKATPKSLPMKVPAPPVSAPAPTQAPAPPADDSLDFASLDELDSKKSAAKSNLAFVNPYSTGEIGGAVDPLTDLKSFLNTVDPSKPIDPELKNLLGVISKNIEDDEEILKDLQKIKKKVKDKKLEALLDQTIKKIKEKRD
nr:hypothetical protein [Candidatus Sigynarchaeota archaeon]